MATARRAHRRKVAVEELVSLQKETDRIRNICVLAHVDHGKTSLTDCLVSSNGLISPRLVGTIRYLDSREDEQTRGITMESSAISLLYEHIPVTLRAGAAPEKKDFLVNLIDSPGHVDFSSDVSTAVRLCDGALVVVDVIEGVCIQTHAVLRQAWEEKLRPCLVLNKIDRLIEELQLDAVEAYDHLNRIVEQVNAVMSGFINADVLKQDALESDNDESGNSKSEEQKGERGKEQEMQKGGEGGSEAQVDHGMSADESAENEFLFMPERGNVVFASAVDGWAFRLHDFLPLLHSKIGADLSPKQLLRVMWGYFFYNAKASKIEKIRRVHASESKGNSRLQTQIRVFSRYVFQSIIDIYRSSVIEPKPKRLQKILSHLALEESVDAREFRKGGKPALKALMSAWLPVSRAVLSMVVRCLPSPKSAQAARIEALLPAAREVQAGSDTEGFGRFRKVVKQCDTSPSAPLVAFVSKMFAVQTAKLPLEAQKFLQAAREADEGGDDAQGSTDHEAFLAFTRVFAGHARKGELVHVLGPKYTGGSAHMTTVTHGFLPMMIMSTELVPLDEVPAGNICALLGLSEHILKTATVTTASPGFSLSRMPTQSAAILRVSIQPVNPDDWPALVVGLRLLNRADPVVDIRLQPNGEYVLGAIGELHLERCVKDLRERFARVEVSISEPIALFLETLVPFGKAVRGPSHKFSDLEQVPSIVSAATADGFVTIHLRMLPIPEPLVRIIEAHAATIAACVEIEDEQDEKQQPLHAMSTGSASNMDEFRMRLQAVLSELEDDWKECLSRVLAFGPHGTGPNLLLHNLGENGYFYNAAQARSLFRQDADEQVDVPREDGMGMSGLAGQVLNGLISGFQLATRAGPLCEEPLWGCAVVVESIEVGDDEAENSLKLGPLSGQIMSCVKEGVRAAYLVHREKEDSGCQVRLAEGTYRCQLQCHVDLHQGETLGKLYSVISKRRGKIIKEEMWEGTSIFTIEAFIPVVEAFGLADDLRKQTSGAASTPQLVFSHFQVLDVNPFFKATTEEELEEHGETADDSYMAKNIARRYMDNVRRRKGLAVREKIVVHAEKQRTLTKMK